ncbi:unnamed protein product [Lymnaea stagnalis]|uniref:CARD domain-containing protein n=1 Tax=Lymnaea stagnalis TaxID=6523 RepID=A0AAV2I6K1_LYMST
MDRPLSGRLCNRDETRLKQNYVKVKAGIEPRRMIDFLFSKGFLNNDEKELISNKQSREDRAEVLLQRVLHCGPGEGYSIFLQALDEAGYSHLSTLLRCPEQNAMNQAASNAIHKPARH